MKRSKLPDWYKNYAVFCVFSWSVLQLAFVLIQSQIAEKVETAVSSILTGTNAAINPYYLSQASAGFEAGGLVSCVRIRKQGQGTYFYESSGSYCSSHADSKLFLAGEGRSAFVKSANGEDWEIQFHAENGPLFYFTLWALRVFLLVAGAVIFSLDSWRRESQRRLETARLKFAVEMASLAEQVAHDIRSPLGALEVVLSDVASMPAEQRTLIRAAAARIKEIAGDLLNYRNGVAKATRVPLRASSIADLLGPILAEKRAQYRDRNKIEFQTRLTPDSGEVFLLVPPSDFSRVISNLVNNAFEATTSGLIQVGVDTSVDIVSIFVKDGGCGIPPEVLKKLGQSKISHGKSGQESGSGLGVFHAQACVAEWGGQLEIESRVGKGTTITLKLPRVELPSAIMPSPASASELSLADTILVDDDSTMHTMWRISAVRVGRRLVNFSSATAMAVELKHISKEAEIYLDESLGEGEPSGFDFANTLYGKGFRNIYLATGSPAENFPTVPWIKKVIGKSPPWI